MQAQDFYNDTDNKSEDANLRQQLEKYIIHWRWFLVSVVICLTAVFLYLRYATPIYEATTAILVKDEKKGGMLSELSAFSDLGIGGGSVNNVDNEIEILRSRTIVESTVKKLNLNINLIAEGSVVDRDIYKDASIRVSFIDQTDLFKDAKSALRYNALTNNTFELTNDIDNENIILANKKVFNYGEKIPTSLGNLIINKTNNIVDNTRINYKSVKISIKPIESVAESYKGRINVEPISKTSSVVNISITDPVKKRAEVFLDNMIQIYNQDAAQDKNFISENTSQFIAGRLALIAKELDGVEQDVESFKKTNRLTDIESEAKLFIEGSSEYDKKGVETEIQLNVVSSLLDFIKKSTNSD